MPFCPQCGREYQDWAKKCYYCQIDLVDKLPDVPQESVFDVSSDPLVTIASFSYPQEAYLHQALLDYTGIDCFVADDYIVTANWLYSTAVGGVKLQVRESDVEDAFAVLNDVVQTDTENAPDTIGLDDEKCPRCNSENIRQEVFDIRLLNIPWILLQFRLTYLIHLLNMIWILLLFPLPFVMRRRQCRVCGNKWKQKKRSSSGNAQ